MRATSSALLAFVLGAAGPSWAFDHGPLDSILRTHVKRGRVDYAGIKSRKQAQLEAYVRAVGGADLRSLGRSDKLAFYLNAYNALVIKAVVDRHPGIKSVIKVRGFFDRFKHTVAGRRVTLNELEKKLIGPFKDPRTHFALVCAARSCPPLRARAFRGRGLGRALDELARAFINSRAGVRVRGSGVEISTIFKWYAKDFRAAAGSVGRYLARYHRRHARLIRGTTRFGYIRYDWALNKL